PVTAITNVKRVHRPTRLVVDRFHWLTTLFLFNDRRTTEIYTLSLHDALPISALKSYCWGSNLISKTFFSTRVHPFPVTRSIRPLDRKSTRLNSSHDQISYAVFCLKKKRKVRRPPGGSGRPFTGAGRHLPHARS